MSKRIVLTLALIAALAAAGAPAYYWWKGRESTQAYRFGKVERGPITAVVSATGTLNPVVSVQVGSQVSGQVTELYVDFNSQVKKGQLIARIDPDSFRLRVNQAMADLEAARATVLTQRANVAAVQAEVSRARVNLADARRELERNKMLAEKNFISASVLDKSQAAFDAIVDVAPVLLPDPVFGFGQGHAVGEALELLKLGQLLRTSAADGHVFFKDLSPAIVQFVVEIGHHQVLILSAGHTG